MKHAKKYVVLIIFSFILLQSLALFAATLGNITHFSRNGATFTISCGTPKVRVIFYTPEIFRIWIEPDGNFTKPSANITGIVVNNNFPIPSVTYSDAGNYHKMETPRFVLRAYKNPCKFAMYEKNNSTLIWQESAPITYGIKTYQTLTRQTNENFYGCGMQNGRFSHRGTTKAIKRGGWNEGDHPNPAPMYLSSAGYGVFRNTYSIGSYNFGPTMTMSHDENRFEAYYFYGDLKNTLNGYTKITGRPFLAPRYGLGFGDADNYTNPSAGDFTAIEVLDVADEYKFRDLPVGWFLPNDGYGSEARDLHIVGPSLRSRGSQLGLWTQKKPTNLITEVRDYGVRVYKLDVAYSSTLSYKGLLNACQDVYDTIEDYSTDNARGFVWTVFGWAGTQRNSVIWSGDQSGTWDYIRWHIPTITGSGLSGFNYATGDVEGIYGGSADVYIRDMQFKCFTTAFMIISNWAPKDKQPWHYNTSDTAINRKYMKLKNRLYPYHNTYANIAYETGVPNSRAMVLEFADDPATWGTQTQYQFMAGEYFLVAPVYNSTQHLSEQRDGIYLPKGRWTDYWTGQVYEGPAQTISYYTPRDRLPLLVKGGAIIPMYDEWNNENDYSNTNLTLDVYPYGKSRFELYEDDGLTQSHRTGSFAKQIFTCDDQGTGSITFTIGSSNGTYSGKPSNRNYMVQIHTQLGPKTVTSDGQLLTEYASLADLSSAFSGWTYDGSKDISYIKTGSKSSGHRFNIVLELSTNPGPILRPIPQSGWSLLYTDSEETVSENGSAANAFDGNSTTIWHTKYSSTTDPLPHEIQIDIGTSYTIGGFRYLPRQIGTNGNIGQYEFYISMDGSNWGSPEATGTFPDNQGTKEVLFNAKTGRYIRLKAITEAGNTGSWTSAAEINALEYLRDGAITLE